MNFGVLSKQIELSDWHSSLTSSLSCCCLWPYFWSNLKNLVGEIYQILFILDQFYHPTCLKGQKCDRFFHTQVGWKKWEVSLQILLASFLDALQINYLLYLCHTSSFMKKVTSISDSEVEKIMKSRSKNSSKYQNAVCPFFLPYVLTDILQSSPGSYIHVCVTSECKTVIKSYYIWSSFFKAIALPRARNQQFIFLPAYIAQDFIKRSQYCRKCYVKQKGLSKVGVT